MKPPISSCQCLVSVLNHSASSTNENAPITAPARLPTPPRITISIALPDWCHDAISGLTKPNWIAYR